MRLLTYLLAGAVTLLAAYFIPSKPEKKLLAAFFTPPRPEVKWYSWNEGYAMAKQQNKMIYLYVYGSGCPNCKVMERESFRDKEIVGMLNYNCISIKLCPDNLREKFKMDSYTLNARQLLMLLSRNKWGGYPAHLFIYPGESNVREADLLTGYQKADDFQVNLDGALNKKRLADKTRCPNGDC